MAVIGIDLGTSNSAVAVLRGGHPVIIPSAEGVSLGGKAFPSYVAVTADGQILVGEPVPVVDAVLGTELEVPTLDGPTTVTIPPGTQPDTVLRLHGKGLPTFGSDKRGDFYLRLHVHVPDRLSPTERDFYQRLRALSA
jgi:DnaJ-class molecular chaperone